MARKSTSRAGAESTGNVIDRTDVGASIPPTSSEPRSGSVFSLEMVNVFGEPAAESAGTAPGARLQLTAWVNNVTYLKDVWVDAYLTDASGAVAHKETLLLDYREGAGGGGDFFVLDAPIMVRGGGRKGTNPPVTSLQYRLYYQIGDTVFAEGILREHALSAQGATGTPGLEVTRAALESSGTQASPATGAPPTLTARATPKVVASSDGVPAKRTTKAKKTDTSIPNGSGDGEPPPKRTFRRRPSA